MKEQAKKRTKETIRNGLLILIAVLITGYLLVAGVWELLGTKNRVTVQLIDGEAYMDVEHSAMGIIPIGKDHYFIGKAVNGDKTEIYVICAGKKWADKTFDENDKVEVTGLKKRFDYDVEQEISKDMVGVDVSTVPFGTSYYLDVNYKFAAVMKIISGILFLAAAAMAILRKLFKFQNKVMTFLPSVLVLAGLAVALFGIR